ncbi:DedA family protein [Thiobacillus sp.]|uniref:DedA family protein n=1 Tax=Thiobacillus sp. TaxID=924 RepID=UPI001E000B04|nr:DedA family protein [Thiobacillus sp.]MBC2758536.1 DedA family protein [Thiobacillus sp.]
MPFAHSNRHPAPRGALYNPYMDIAALIAQYGYAAVFLGALFEGESVLLLAGYAAHRGYLDFPVLTVVAGVGAMTGDQFFFWLGRRHGQALLARRPVWRSKVEYALELVQRHPVGIILVMRFMWGLRIALPVAVGLSDVARWRFFWLNLASAALWAPLVGGAGYVFGALLSSHLAVLHQVEHWVMLGLVVVLLALRGFLHSRHTRS